LVEDQVDLNQMIGRITGLITRQRWLLLIVSSVVALIAVAIVMRLPDHYTSEATLVVIQQQVSQRYVEPSTNMTVPDAVQAMTRQVLSRARLMVIIDELGLYGNARNSLAPEQTVALMRKDVVVEPLDETRGNFSAFKISFTADTAQVAQAVTGRLATFFIEEQSKIRGNQAATTTNFLKEQLEAVKQKLKETDDRRRGFKTQYLGELPERQGSNFEMLTELRSQLQSVNANLSRTQQQRITLQSSVGERLARLQSEREKLLIRYTPKYFDVVKKDQEIAEATAILERLKTQRHGGDRTIATDPSMSAMESQAEANQQEADDLLKEEKRLRAEIGQYQNRLNLTPVREQQLAEILRDYDLYAQNVRELQSRLLQAQQATSVEEQQEGQKFRLVDPPTLPTTPSSPKRVVMNLGGVLAGIVIGLVLAFLKDSRDRSFHSEKALTQLYAMPLVLSLPLLLTPAEERGRKWKRALEWTAGCAIALTLGAVEFYVYRRG
jgi:polysaccharide biosynthesis transport protein